MKNILSVLQYNCIFVTKQIRRKDSDGKKRECKHGGSDGKASACNAGAWFHPWVGKIPWRRKWHPTPVLLPGKSLGPRSLVGYSPWGRKESDTTERLHFTSLHFTSNSIY